LYADRGGERERDHSPRSGELANKGRVFSVERGKIARSLGRGYVFADPLQTSIPGPNEERTSPTITPVRGRRREFWTGCFVTNEKITTASFGGREDRTNRFEQGPTQHRIRTETKRNHRGKVLQKVVPADGSAQISGEEIRAETTKDWGFGPNRTKRNMGPPRLGGGVRRKQNRKHTFQNRGSGVPAKKMTKASYNSMLSGLAQVERVPSQRGVEMNSEATRMYETNKPDLKDES